MATEITELVDEIERAFATETVIDECGMLAPRFAGSDDPVEFSKAVAGQDWRSLEAQTLFYHRESLGMLSALGYRALIAAFLRASLIGPDDYASDLMGASVSSFHALSDEADDVEDASTRVSLLTLQQRSAIASYLLHVAETYDDKEAKEVFASWVLIGADEEE